MVRASRKISNERLQDRKEQVNLQKSKGKLWRKKDDEIIVKLANSVQLMDGSRRLAEDELLEMLALLLNSCRYSIMRTKDKGKQTYYGKFHQFANHRQMLSEIIHKDGFLNNWTNGYIRYKEKRRMDNRPTLGRIDHEKGYTLDNIEVQPFNNNAAQRATERFSMPCIALVAIKADSSAILFECPSARNAIDRINEVLELGITKGMLKGNLENGLNRVDADYSVFIISRDKLMAEPLVADMGITMNNIIDDASVRLVVLPEISEAGCSKVHLHLDDLGIVYADFVEGANGDDLIAAGIKNTKMKEAITI